MDRSDPPVCQAETCQVVMRFDVTSPGGAPMDGPRCPVCLTARWTETLPQLAPSRRSEFNRNTAKFHMWRTKHRVAASRLLATGTPPR